MSELSLSEMERIGNEITSNFDEVISAYLSLIGEEVSEEEIVGDILKLDPDAYNWFISRFFYIWSNKSDTFNAKLYRMGRLQAIADTKIKNHMRATNGRRLIGATSREKVKKAAQSFKHLSKSNASYKMAELVNLDPGTIKRYLTELFPGDKWTQ